MEDNIVFLIQMAQVKEKHPFDLHAFCLLTNHFHLEITTADEPIWKIMQFLMNSYAKTFNRQHDFSGHLFDSRYAAGLIEDERYFLEVSRYIHLNPVKAMMVREPLAYPYSSYGDYVSDESGVKGSIFSDLLETSRVLNCFLHNSREQYRMFVEGKISHAEQEMLIQKEMREDEMWLPW